MRRDERFLFVESNGLPAHNMMVGHYLVAAAGAAAAELHGHECVAVPAFAGAGKDAAVDQGAIPARGDRDRGEWDPDFQSANNRGEVSAEIGELDEWGGHCGRADDYHYHAAPLHLQTVLGAKLPVAYALDGYPTTD